MTRTRLLPVTLTVTFTVDSTTTTSFVTTSVPVDGSTRVIEELPGTWRGILGEPY